MKLPVSQAATRNDNPRPRILLVRLSAIGDVVHGLPVLCALRAAWPQSLLGWVVEGRAGDLLAGHPALDSLLRVPRGWLRRPAEVLALRRRLGDLHFDITIDMQGLTKSAVCARLSGARRRIGFGGVDGRELSTWLNNELVRPQRTHVIDRNLELLSPLGIRAPRVSFDLAQQPADARAIESFLQQARLASSFALLNCGAGWPSKLWPRERFAEVARYLARVRKLPTVVAWAGAQELAWAEEIVALAAGAAQLAPPTTLTELAALARRAAVCVASDTGPLHIAAAVGTPCVGLFGPMPGARNGPYGPQHEIVQAMQPAARRRGRRRAGPESMLAITVEHVCRACDRVLERSARRCA